MKNIINKFKILDKKTIKVMKYGFRLALYFCIIATFILITYQIHNSPSSFFYVGISLLKSGLFFTVATTIYGFVFSPQ